jgi:hypothetical protein
VIASSESSLPSIALVKAALISFTDLKRSSGSLASARENQASIAAVSPRQRDEGGGNGSSRILESLSIRDWDWKGSAPVSSL